MNKQEMIEKIEKEKSNLNAWEDLTRNRALNDALAIVRQLDEPEKVVVPQFVAEWYEANKDGFEYNLYSLCIDFHERKLHEDLHEWFTNNKNKPIEVLVLMNKYGYEVEKEKLYTVKFSNEDFGKTYIGIIKTANKIGISTVPINDECSKCYFTKSELEEFKFWNNPAFEIKEVEK